MPNYPKFRALDVAFIDYDTETSPFTKGKTLTGSPSTGTGIIEKVSDFGTYGTLQLVGVSATPIADGDTITDDNGTPGSATADGDLYYLEYTWERWDDQDAPPVASGRNKRFFDRFASTPHSKIIGIEGDSFRRFYPISFPVISLAEVVEFRKWAKRRVFWLYPNSDLSTRYKVEWQTYPFAPERLPGGDYALDFVLAQVDEEA